MTPDDSPINIAESVITFGMFCGALWDNASISNCKNYAYVKACSGAGIVGMMYGGMVEKCINYGNIVAVGTEVIAEEYVSPHHCLFFGAIDCIYDAFLKQ